ncbi:MAG: cupredoxin domain-containing protein [Candidatus Levybacteria bacterium]|nr:cupredoxin domain-containing protein [Candidatus Levybacteria bacterium]
MGKFLIVIIAIAIIAGVFIFGAKKSSNQAPVQQGSQSQQVTTSPAQEQKQSEAIVTVTTSGFVPQTLTIKAGTKVVWMNKSGTTVTVNSAVHPTHLAYPPLNLGEFGDGSSVQLGFDKPGTYSYHDHLNPSQTGTIVVE